MPNTAILLIGCLANVVAWLSVEILDTVTMPIRSIFLVGVLLLPILAFLSWTKRATFELIDNLTVAYVAGIAAITMGIGFYTVKGDQVALEYLYMWIPVMYMFTFAQANLKQALLKAIALWFLLFLVSLPFLFQNTPSPRAFVNIQLHLVSAFIIISFFFFAMYQQHLRLAKLSVDELDALANTDSLTQVANRRRLTELIKNEQLRFTRYHHGYAIILLDIDHFKRFNDHFGHDVGDRLLQALTGRIKEVLREVDCLARWGGEEFLVLLPETSFAEAQLKANKLCEHIAARALLDNHLVTVSCGVTAAREGDTYETLFRRADKALYKAKYEGRNRVEGFPPEKLVA